MTTGSAKVKTDDRGRLAIPTRMRDDLLSAGDNEWILTANPHQCLSLYAPKQFNIIKREFSKLANVGFMESHMEELIIGSAEPVILDNAGRILIPNALRTFADIKRDVLLFSVANSVRIWDHERWEQRQVLVLSRLQDEGLSEPWKTLRI